MNIALLLAALAGLAAAGSFVSKEIDVQVGSDYVDRQKKVFSLFKNIYQTDYESEWYKIGKEWSIEANFDKYNKREVVEEYWTKYLKTGFLPKGQLFSVFYDDMRNDAIAIFNIFYYAKDFDTFYKTACWARVHMNEHMFMYIFNLAVLHRIDTRDIVLPAPYEINPFFFSGSYDVARIHIIKQQNGVINKERALYTFGIDFEDNVYTVLSNYSRFHNQINRDQYDLAYFTEDIGLNSYYYYFHSNYPFWLGGEDFGLFKERRGEYFYYFHQQLLARYYLERLSNGLSEIPKLSWRLPVETGYSPDFYYSASSRPNHYNLAISENEEQLEFVQTFEKHFKDIINKGFSKTDKDTDTHLSTTKFEWLGNYLQYNPDAFQGKYPSKYNKYYEIITRILLGLNMKQLNGRSIGLNTLEHFETALQDPVFYQLYNRVINFFQQYKEQHLEPYTVEDLHFDTVKVDNVKVGKLVTFFDTFDFAASNAAYYSQKEMKNIPYRFAIRTPRLNHLPFDVEVNVVSGKDVEAVVKFFIGPKYDSKGNVLTWNENKNNFFEVDAFEYKLSTGENSIVRNSQNFTVFTGDFVSAYELFQNLDATKVPKDRLLNYNAFPERLMLPKGTKSGFPLQFFVIVYPYATKDAPEFNTWLSFGTRSYPRYLDAKPMGYPFDRRIDNSFFYQPNMHVEDVIVYHEGTEKVYDFQWFNRSNEVAKN